MRFVIWLVLIGFTPTTLAAGSEPPLEASYHLGMKLGGGAAVPVSFIALLAIAVMGSVGSGEIY